MGTALGNSPLGFRGVQNSIALTQIGMLTLTPWNPNKTVTKSARAQAPERAVRLTAYTTHP